MAPNDTATKPERPTLSRQLARQHELLMAQATKQARVTPQSVELAERHAGPRDGELRLASLALVQHDDESDVQFVGRLEEFTRSVLAARDRLNAEQAAGVPAATDEGGE